MRLWPFYKSCVWSFKKRTISHVNSAPAPQAKISASACYFVLTRKVMCCESQSQVLTFSFHHRTAFTLSNREKERKKCAKRVREYGKICESQRTIITSTGAPQSKGWAESWVCRRPSVSPHNWTWSCYLLSSAPRRLVLSLLNWIEISVKHNPSLAVLQVHSAQSGVRP